MAAYYFDSSALVKRYTQEVGTGWVVSLTDPRAGHAIQLASALAVQAELIASGVSPLVFVSADADLDKAARVEGLVVENPNDPP